MLWWTDEVWHRRKSLWAAWGIPVGAIVFVVGCHSTQTPDELIDPRSATSHAISVYPKVSVSSSSQANPSSNGASGSNILQAQAVEVSRSGEPLVTTGQTAKGANASGGGVGISEVFGSSPPVSASNALDLDVALRLAGVDNPTINLAQERIREALAQQLNARVLLLPNLNIGGNYHYNNGPVQSSSGQILPVADQALYMGFGAGAVGAGSVAIPGMWLSAQLGDAVYEPLAARENVAARRSDSVATQNAVMGDVVTAYLRLVGSQARLDVLRLGDVEGAEVVRLTAEFAKAGQGLPADANRSRAFNDLIERERLAAEEEVEVASVQLCRLLNIDPSNHFRTAGLLLKLTDQVFVALKNERVSESVLMRLNDLKDREFSLNHFVWEIKKILNADEEIRNANKTEYFLRLILNHVAPRVSLEIFRLIPEDSDAEVLIAQAIQARPELATRYANIREAQVRVRQEKIRPFLPTVSVGVSTAAFGGQSNLVSPSFSPLASRTDIDAMAVWNHQNLGFGNRARVREANAVVGQALAEYDSTKNRIRREVLDALADAQAAARQLELAQSAVHNSIEGFQLDLLRIKGGAGKGRNAPRPIDLLDSFKGILEARQELVAAVTGFDTAQFRLFVAIGSNPLNGPDVTRAVPAAVPNVPIGTQPVSPKPTPILPPLAAPGKP